MTAQTEETTKGPKQLSLKELEKLEIPYGKSKILKAYNDASFDRDRTVNERAYDDNFLPLAKGQQEDRPRPITMVVEGIMRLKHKGTEYLVWQGSLRSTDWKRNPINQTLVSFGKYELPTFQYEVDPNTNKVIPEKTQVSGFETIYDIPFSKEKARELVNMSSDDGGAVLSMSIRDQSGKRWSCSKQEFVNMDFDELVDRKSGFAAYLEERKSSSGLRK